jgi:hypothetical protein
MSPLLLAFLAVTLGAVYVVVRRRASAVAPALADTAHYSLDWVTAHDLSPLAGGGREAPQAGGWQTVAVEGLSAAEDLLDALEAAGYEELELLVRRGTEFVVRWR